MRTMMPRLAILLACTVWVVGCEGSPYGPKQQAGTLLGGIGGAVAGAQFGSGSGQLAGTAVGTLLGAFIGQEVGASLDRADQLYDRRNHSQQVPNPYLAPQRRRGAFGYRPIAPRPAPVYGSWTAANCEPLASPDAFGRARYACQAPNGGWFVTD